MKQCVKNMRYRPMFHYDSALIMFFSTTELDLGDAVVPFQWWAAVGLCLSPSRHLSRACWILSSVHEVCCIFTTQVLQWDNKNKSDVKYMKIWSSYKKYKYICMRVCRPLSLNMQYVWSGLFCVTEHLLRSIKKKSTPPCRNIPFYVKYID